MATVIPSEIVEAHSVNKYNFKVIALGSKEDANSESHTPQSTLTSPQPSPVAQAQEIDSSGLSTESKESLIESLMKKTDEMSSNFIKLQMKLEAKEEEFAAELEKAKEKAFAEGMEAGRAKAIEDGEISISESIELFSKSVQKLDTSAEEFKTALEHIKADLVVAALDIAKEVIKVELGTNASEIATLLAKEIISDLQNASAITLKVNPQDHAKVSESLGKMENVTIMADSAISSGGVVVMSDAGNIDAEVSKRFERVRRAALSE